MAPAPANMYADVLRHDLCAFIHRSFLELNPQTRFHTSGHIEVLAAQLEDVRQRQGRCKRLIVNMPPRLLKSHAISISFPAWVLGHDPAKQILTVTYAQDLSDNFARKSRSLMTSVFYEALFNTRLLRGREAVSDYETTAGGCRLSTSVGGVLTGRGADIIIVDDPLKADDALSEVRRRSVNEWFDNTLRSRLNNQEDRRQSSLSRNVFMLMIWLLMFSSTSRGTCCPFLLLLNEMSTMNSVTPYGRKQINRRAGELLQPSLLSQSTLESQRRAMTEYNFVAQYQQDPQPPSGVIVKRHWLKYYEQNDLPKNFERIVQSWDTANKDSELANYSVCTTWGLKDRLMYLLDVFRRKLNFPELKRAVRELANLHNANVVLIEDKASGTSLIQELRAERFLLVQEAPKIDGDKVMRLHSQTAKIEGGFVLFPKQAHWLDTYLLELLTFPNAKTDDQVNSTVYALAWMTLNLPNLHLERHSPRRSFAIHGGNGL